MANRMRTNGCGPGCGCQECTEGEEPTPSFSWAMASFFPTFRINLFDESTVHENCDGEITEWEWYKNGETTPFSTVQNPTNVAMVAGDTIRLKVTDSCKCSAETVGEFLAPCLNLSAWLSAHSLYVKLDGGTFANDPGCCIGFWTDEIAVVKNADSVLECEDQLLTYTCGAPVKAWTDSYIRCVGDYLGCDLRLCHEGALIWSVTRTFTFPPFVTLGIWYDMGVVTRTGSASANCYPSSGMHMYAKWV